MNTRLDRALVLARLHAIEARAAMHAAKADPQRNDFKAAVSGYDYAVDRLIAAVGDVLRPRSDNRP